MAETIDNTSSVANVSSGFPPGLTFGDVVRQPVPLQPRKVTRFMSKACLALYRKRILEVEGIEHIQPENDPFIFVANHSQQPEAILIPSILFHHRKGKLVHFMADWNFCLIPIIALIYNCGEVITVDRKPAKPAFLNVFKPLFTSKVPPFEQAQKKMAEGKSIGIFPEGTTNRDPNNLLRGFPGAAHLSLTTGAKVVPAGISFPLHPKNEPISNRARMKITIGSPIEPPSCGDKADRKLVRSWHETMMAEVARLSGKKWDPKSKRKKQYVDPEKT